MQTNFIKSSLLLLAALFLFGCQSMPKKTSAIEGEWAFASATLGGKDLPLAVFGNSHLNLVAGHYEFQKDVGDYVILPGSDPAATDVVGRQGPNAGKTIPAIYRLDGDSLTICYDLSSKARPSAFQSDTGSQIFLVKYVRVK
jgi:uncharacterized protein (TIGR03067 family)